MVRKIDKKFLFRVFIVALFALAVIYVKPILNGAMTIWDAVFALVLGCAIAFILNIVLGLLEKIYFPNSKNLFVIKTRRPICITLAILVILTIIFLLFKLVIPELINAFSVIGEMIPVYFEYVRDWVVANMDFFPSIGEYLLELEINWSSIIKSVASYAATGLTNILDSTLSIVGTMVGGLANFVIGLIFAIYILASKEKLSKNIHSVMKAYIKPSFNQKFLNIVSTANHTFSRFIVGQCTEAVILGILCTVGMLILQFPYATMIGVVVGVMALIPIIGAFIGAAFGAFIIFTVSPVKALLFILFIIILQQLEGHLIYPKVVGSSIGLPGLWVLAAVAVGGTLGGIPGILLGVPLTATFYKLLREDVNKRLSAKGDSVLEETSYSPPEEREAKE